MLWLTTRYSWTKYKTTYKRFLKTYFQYFNSKFGRYSWAIFINSCLEQCHENEDVLHVVKLCESCGFAEFFLFFKSIPTLQKLVGDVAAFRTDKLGTGYFLWPNLSIQFKNFFRR